MAAFPKYLLSKFLAQAVYTAKSQALISA